MKKQTINTFISILKFIFTVVVTSVLTTVFGVLNPFLYFYMLFQKY